MFAKLAVLSSAAALVAAEYYPITTTITVTAGPTSPQPATQCSPGPVQCCNQLESSDTLIGAYILALFGIELSGPSVPIGLTCSPLTVIGVPSASCNGEAVCCENNDYNGVIAIGCFPVNIFLK